MAGLSPHDFENVVDDEDDNADDSAEERAWTNEASASPPVQRLHKLLHAEHSTKRHTCLRTPPVCPTAEPPRSIPISEVLDASGRPPFRTRRNVSACGSRVRCSVSALLSDATPSPVLCAEQACTLRAILARHSFAVLTDVPGQVLDTLQKAEAATARFFAAPLKEKQQFEWKAQTHHNKHKVMRMITRGMVAVICC